MDDSGLASLGFVVVCIFAVLVFFGLLALPVILLVLALTSSAKQEQPEEFQEDTQVVSQGTPVENTKEASIERLRAKGVNIRSDVVVKRG